MIEHAVNKSEAAGHGGKLGLTSLSEESGKFYKSVGFKGDPEGDMALNPSKNPEKWSKKEDGTWSLKKNEDKGYMTGKK